MSLQIIDPISHSGSLNQIQNILISLHNGNVSAFTNLSSLDKNLSVPGLATLCIYIERIISVSASQSCYDELFDFSPPYDMNTTQVLRNFMFPTHSVPSSFTPQIPRMLFCTSSRRYRDEINLCVRSVAAVYYAYAIIRSTLDMARMKNLVGYFNEAKNMKPLRNETICVQRIIALLLGDTAESQSSDMAQSCYSLCSSMMPPKSSIHQSLCHFAFVNFDSDNSFALSSMLMNVGAREASVALAKKSIIRLHGDTVRMPEMVVIDWSFGWQLRTAILGTDTIPLFVLPHVEMN